MNRFNLRVYGIILNDKDEILISDERRFGRSFTKFPGGGLEHGEGIKECLEREIKEELGIESEIGDMFYFNDFYQVSAFNEKEQLCSFYYIVDSIDFNLIPDSNHTPPLKEEGEKFRWIHRSEMNENLFTFPIDKSVASMLKDL
jgi:8-oxo-dGTP diphosphatase